MLLNAEEHQVWKEATAKAAAEKAAAEEVANRGREGRRNPPPEATAAEATAITINNTK